MRTTQTWQAWPQALRIWVVAMCLAQSLDVLTTMIGLRLGIVEGNPLMASILASQSELAMYGMKALAMTAVVLAVLGLRRRYPLVWPLFQVLTVLVLLVVVNNVVYIAQAFRVSG